MSEIKIISAGAGSGKTYRLTQEMFELLKSGVRARGIVATTFTEKAATELKERVRVKLLQEGMTEAANELSNALIGTVHSLGVKLLRRFAFEAGVSPLVDIIADEDQQSLFNKSLATVLYLDRISEMDELSERLGLSKKSAYDWRRDIKTLTDIARSNDFPASVLEESRRRSFESFRTFLPEISTQAGAGMNQHLLELLESTIARLENANDTTKATFEVVNDLKNIRNDLRWKGKLNWHQWVKIAKHETKTSKKSQEHVAELAAFAWSHETHPDFQADIKAFIDLMFTIAIEAICEYDQYKKQRGLIDYIDMEIQVKRLLEHPRVQSVLRDELDLLMVDEFQDTSPIQLDIFIKLSAFARHSIWVGDPKQSIYGFRGAEPRLMQAVIQKAGGISADNILKDSYRSRPEIVQLTNAVFTKAFSTMPPEQVVLQPVRKDLPDMSPSLHLWEFQYDGEGKRLPAKPWTENCIAESIRVLLSRQWLIHPKDGSGLRPLQPGDIGILCRSNADCQQVAEALHRTGLKAAISRTGLLNTVEAKLVIACLRYILNRYDSLAVAEILLLAGGKTTEEILADRLAYLAALDPDSRDWRWAIEQPIIGRLNELRSETAELSGAEILNLALEELDLRRSIVRWGNDQQRLDNVDMLRKYALQYEEACNRMHSAASLGGFLLWLNDLEENNLDAQSSGENSEAVNVLTYHKSKGLEFPLVICHSLETSLRDKVWGANILSDRDEVDLNDVLGGRWIRYWVNPYADLSRNTPLEERINASAEKSFATELALQEDARLLYVGITRARDYLIFPITCNPTRWFNRIWHNGIEDHPTLDASSVESIWDWEGRPILMHPETFVYPRDFTHADPAPRMVMYPEVRAGKKWHPRFLIDPERDSFNDEFTAKAIERGNYAPALPCDPDADTYAIAKAFKAFLTARQPGADDAQYREMANGLIQRFGVSDWIDADPFLGNSDALARYLEREFPARKIHRKYPIRLARDARLFETVADLVLETDAGIVLIQNSGFSGEKRLRKAMELASWFYLSKLALEFIFKPAKIRTFVHFVMTGVLVEVEIM